MIRARRTAYPIGSVEHKFHNRNGTVRLVQVPIYGTEYVGLTREQKQAMTVDDFRAIGAAEIKRERRRIRNRDGCGSQ